MPCTLYETLSKIDPFVRMNDGSGARTVQQILFSLNTRDPAEYLLRLDGLGRFIIFRLDHRGMLISPPAYVEERAIPVSNAVHNPATAMADKSHRTLHA